MSTLLLGVEGVAFRALSETNADAIEAPILEGL
jgi:hypothetical protein